MREKAFDLLHRFGAVRRLIKKDIRNLEVRRLARLRRKPSSSSTSMTFKETHSFPDIGASPTGKAVVFFP